MEEIQDFSVGDKIRIYIKIKEGDKERTQRFEGIVIKERGSGIGKTFTVRRVSYGIGIERIFPLHSPNIQKIQVVKRGNVRRAKLYYLRGRKGKSAMKVKET
ncbi:MAG: 50S ribosomal protein L19 [bacterium (Candidatus Stahlbacteria) CG08_land_8_20_14_0_20_40_26]|nr:MAG: 50S ribosomal protein L19 [bacterium (Candidatus Stahlbacteria) CG23_combo_of_CG06-09_8_20_14_all_40_9]PIS25558.1 MAG: 50S ribosomal protein L19 [bacterium (Candidatus Stahlbacteria) CG08_land_8_20_14_0_20_40_26]